MWWLVLVLWLLPGVAWGACSGSSPSWNCSTWSDAETLIEGASILAGDTVTLATGSYTASSTITVTDAGVKIVGATTGCPGTVASNTCVDNTVITPSVEAFNITVNNVDISGLTFTGTCGGHACIHVDDHSGPGGITGVRIHHNHWANMTGGVGIMLGQGRRTDAENSDNTINLALIDNNRWDFPGDNMKAIQLYGGGGLWSLSTWVTGTGQLGGANMQFVEDNVFVALSHSGTTSVIDNYVNPDSVIRFNAFSVGRVTFHGVEANDPAIYKYESVHLWEVYKNTFVGDGFYRRMEFRGGTGMVWGNTVTGTISGRPILYYYTRGDRYDNATDNYCQRVTACDGTILYATDGNESGKDGYPCYQQIGMTGATGITKKPAYQWGNTWGAITAESLQSSITYNAECGYQHVQYDRDVMLVEPAMSGGTPPGTCTTGQGYWKTDEGYWNSKNDTPVRTADGVLYKCVAGVWTPYYTPYPYPHPLRSGLGAPTGVTQE